MKIVNAILLIVVSFCFINTKLLGAEKIKILSSASIFEDIAANIGGSLVITDCIVPIGGDPHIYEPVPRDAQKTIESDLILINGLTFEGWINELIENSGTKAKTVLITEGVEAITSDTYKNASDPHAWMNLLNGKKYAENIKNALVELDPENGSVYEANYKKYIQQIMELHDYVTKEIMTIPVNRRYLITSHDAFKYFGNQYGIQVEGIIGISTDAVAQTSDIRRVNKIIKENGVPAVFVESTINPKMLKQIASDNKVVIGGELFADSIAEKDHPAGTYLGMIKYNTDTIVNGLRNDAAMVEQGTKGNSNLVYILLGVFMLLILIFVVRQLNK